MAISGKAFTLGGNGRADTLGHSAKYEIYGLLDLDLMHVLHKELVQVSVFNFPVWNKNLIQMEKKFISFSTMNIY